MNAAVGTKKSYWPQAIIVFFVVIISVNILLLKLASSGYTGILDTHPYEKGLSYEQDINEQKAFLESGITISIEQNPFRIIINDKDGNLLSNLKVSVEGKRSNTKEDDFDINLKEASQGNYNLEKQLSPGLWLFDIKILKDGKNLRYKTNKHF